MMMVMKKCVAKWGGKLLDRCWQSSPAKRPAIGGNVLKMLYPVAPEGELWVTSWWGGWFPHVCCIDCTFQKGSNIPFV